MAGRRLEAARSRAYREYLRTAERGLHAAEARARIAALPAPMPNMAYAGQTEHDGAIRLLVGPGLHDHRRADLAARHRPAGAARAARLTVWQDDPGRGLAFGDYPDVAIAADDLPLPIRDSRIAYTPERPRTVPAVLSGGSFAFRIGSNPLPPRARP